jgi:uncharacterized protein (TIGR02246 family)
VHAHEPADLHALFQAAINSKDLDALLDLYEPDSLNVGLDGTRFTGESALREMLTGLLATIAQLDGVSRKVIVHGDLALMSASFTGQAVTPDGDRYPFDGTSGEVARRQPDGTWRFLIDDPTFGRA